MQNIPKGKTPFRCAIRPLLLQQYFEIQRKSKVYYFFAIKYLKFKATLDANFLNRPLKVKKNDLKHILAGCRNNDRGSQKALYDRFYGYALTVALLYCSKETEAREVLNDAFIKVFSSIERYDDAHNFTSWLRTIVVRTAINHYHKHLNDPEFQDMTEGLDLSVEDDYLSKMAAEEVVALIQKLSPAYRITLNLFAIEGHTHLEIAEILGISVGASKSNLSKARAKLKQLMTHDLIFRN